MESQLFRRNLDCVFSSDIFENKAEIIDLLSLCIQNYTMSIVRQGFAEFIVLPLGEMKSVIHRAIMV